VAAKDLRLQYRFLDLRRPTLQRNSGAAPSPQQGIRDYLDERALLELETAAAGPQHSRGRRDYLVPSRVSPGAWYALPQSPQLYKSCSCGWRTTIISRSPAVCATRTSALTAA